jgi:hypothetical protein
LPLLLLISSGIGRDARRVALVAVGLLCARVGDVFWWVAPDSARYGSRAFAFYWLDAVALLTIGGLWLALYFWHLDRQPPLEAASKGPR